MTEDMLTGTFDFLAEVVAARTFSTDKVVTETFFVREVITRTFIFSVAETIFLLVEVSGTSAFFFFLFILLLEVALRVCFLFYILLNYLKMSNNIWFKGLLKIIFTKDFEKVCL